MSVKQPHNPSRFDVYNELPDGSGFTVKGCAFVFKFDRFGGWFDEHGNYYNSDGKPDEPHSDSDSYHSEASHQEHSHGPEDQDQFQKQFGGPNNYVEDQDQPEDIHLSKVVRNVSILNNYPSGQPFRVHFKNLPYLSKRNEVFDYFKSKVAGISNVIFLQNQKKQFNGNGYFVVEDIASGQSLLRFQGQKYNNREINFSLEDVEEFLLDPVTNQELYPDFLNKKPLKNFITKGPKVQQKPEPVKEHKQSKVEVKKEVKVESPAKVQIKKAENQQEFLTYIFQRAPFPKKSSFNEWIQLNHFSHQNDIKEVKRIDGDDTKAKVTMKRKIYNALNGKKCNEVLVNFVLA